MKKVRFTKMHGTGNDFVVIDAVSEPELAGEVDLPELARDMCPRRTGVGADGLIVILPDGECDASMRIFNSDGTEAEMCGNGIRCVGKYIYDNGITHTLEPTVNTRSGVKRLMLECDEEDRVMQVSVNMGQARVAVGVTGVRTVCGTYAVRPVSVGNPHGVVYVEGVQTFPVEIVGPALETCELFPERANIEFVERLGARHLRQRTWERGVGETLACGTGAVAVAAAYCTDTGTDDVLISLPGGDLRVRITDDGLLLTGAAATVFTGIYGMRK